jgi:hypothetical protein
MTPVKTAGETMAHSLSPLWGGTLIIGFFCLAWCNKASQSSSPERENASHWALEASDSKELGPPIKMSGFEIRPPVSFLFINAPVAPDHADSLKVGELATATFRESPSIAGVP